MKKDIGIMGGTFDPIHNGHLSLARETLAQFNLDEILVMPSGNPPHKMGQQILDGIHRAEMVKLAIENEPKFTYSDYELTRTGYSYTADTLKELSNNYQNIYFIIGADSLFYIEKWYQPEIIFQLCTLVVANRNHDINEFNQKISELQTNSGAKIEVINNFDCPFSSSEIRNNVSKGISIKGMVPENVEKYILKHHLYKM